jgi:hypothetical protein
VLFVLAAMVSTPAIAGSIYRCVAGDGGVTYSSSRESGQACKGIHYAGGGRSRHRAAVARPPSVGAVMAAGVPTSSTLATLPSIAMRRDAHAPPARGAQLQSPRVEFRTAASASELSAPRLASGARVTRGAVYKFVHDGVTNYTNVRPPGSAGAHVLFTYIETCFACSARPGVNFATLALNTQAFANEIATASRNYGVDESLVRAIIHAESAFNPNALSYKGAQGLMQLMPDTARRFGVGNAFSAADNISGGVQYLAFLSKRFNGDVRLIAAAYNAGEGAVDRYGGVPPYAETQLYVARVGTLAERYRSLAK